MKLKILYVIFLTAIILLGSYLRLAHLASNPNGLYVDEASTGYNAYSILLTGKDEYGKDLPLFFRFLGSYTPPLYTYLTSISIHFFGFNINSIRLVSAISGILLIPLGFFLIKSLNISKYVTALFGALFLAISPWSIFYSRIGYEIHLAFLIYSIGLFLLWRSLKRIWFLVPAGGLLALSSYAYQAQRLLSPLTLITFIFLFREILLKSEYRKVLVTSLMLYFLIMLPQFLLFFTPASTARGFGLFYSEAVTRQAEQTGILLAFLKEFFSQYFAYLSPRNLFFQPDPDMQRSLPEMSTLYPWMVLFYLPGVYLLINNTSKLVRKFILMILILAPIPASLTGDPFSTQRALPLLLPVTLIVVIGLDKILTQRPKFFFASLILIFSIISLLYLYRSYGILLPNERAKTWGYGFEQLTEEIKKRPNEQFLIDSSRIKPAYIELAFFLQIPPNKLQDAVDQSIKKNYYDNTKWDSYYRFANIETRNINWEEDIYKDQILVGDELAISENQAKEHFLEKVFEVRSPSKEIIFKAFKTNPDLKCKNSRQTSDTHCNFYD